MKLLLPNQSLRRIIIAGSKSKAIIALSESMSRNHHIRNDDTDDAWNSDMQPFFARASFMKLCLPAVLYSALFNTILRLLSYFPIINSWLRINPSRLHPDDCFTTSDSSFPPIAIVTGSNTGVGFETAKGLVQQGYHVILACRSRQKGEDAADKINQLLPTSAVSPNGGDDYSTTVGKAIFLQPIDLTSFASIRSFCKAFTEQYESLNVLVNNAGINSQGDVTENGLEICFQSNIVSHFLLTKLLIPSLLKAENVYKNSYFGREAGRVVNLSSVTHHFAPANERTQTIDDGNGTELPENNGIHDKHFWLGSATPGVSSATYRESKLASILFTMELNKRYGDKGIRSIAVNPGSVSSDIWRNESAFTQKMYSILYLTTQEGASTSIAGSICKLPTDAIYLQPYRQPTFRKRNLTGGIKSLERSYSLPFPMFEMLGPYISHSVTTPRLPADGSGGYKSSEHLWDVCESLTAQ